MTSRKLTSAEEWADRIGPNCHDPEEGVSSAARFLGHDPEGELTCIKCIEDTFAACQREAIAYGRQQGFAEAREKAAAVADADDFCDDPSCDGTCMARRIRNLQPTDDDDESED